MLARRLALAIALLAGLIGSQGPEFAQQYRQRLGGALEELNRIVSQFDAEVRRQNLSPAEALKRLEDNSDPLARERGEDMGKAVARAERLNQQIQAMNSAGPLMRLYVVATRFDPEIASSALDNYEPAEPLSIGALTAGGLAALCGWAATRLIAWPFSRGSRLRAARA
jgi:C4-dicarboxylate-specific signal transduction histidine kinase